MEKKPVLYSGIQPTGILTIGNFIGAINNWLKIQEDYFSIYSIVDLHAITVRQDPVEYRSRALSFYAQYIACGLDPEKSILYFQSHVHQHAELTWILNCYSYLGELRRMTQYKEKSKRNADNINVGLLDYPVLMAADILLYQASVVPVGIDQKQHLELARDIAERFNNIYGKTFTIPEVYLGKQGNKVFSLQDPLAKMSKSDPNPDAAVSIIESPDSIARKFKRAVTDSESVVEYRDDKPGISNLLVILSSMTDKSIDALVSEYHDAGYKKFKEDVAEAVIEKLRPVREDYERLMQDKTYLLNIATQGASKAASLAERTIAKVKKKIGLIERPSLN
ncbi:MAG: tryptophan--tRNA ligase [Clostridia bacterium]|jgi:tryptophanyl-tRNA synthetase|nr:tryptophan--tRNA ligase [Clostridia bacterium]